MEGGDGPAQEVPGLGVREMVTGTTTSTPARGQHHLLAQVLLRVPRPAVQYSTEYITLQYSTEHRE